MARRTCQPTAPKIGKPLKNCIGSDHSGRHGHACVARKKARRSSLPCICISCGCVASLALMFAIAFWNGSATLAEDANRPKSKEANADPERPEPTLKLLHTTMMEAEKAAAVDKKNLTAVKSWLAATMAVDEHLVAAGAPQDVRAYTLSEILRISLRSMPWSGLLSQRDLLQKLAPALAEYMLTGEDANTCCSSSTCLYDQVSTAMIFEELGLADVAAKHLQSAEALVSVSDSCMAMVWQLNRLVAPFDEHFPVGYEGLVDAARSKAFWGPKDLPLAGFLERHAPDIVAELAPLCPSGEGPARDHRSHFGEEAVVKDLAHGSWTSLPLLDQGVWNASACESVAPRTCALLKTRNELQGALRSSSKQDTVIQFTFVSVYRLRPGSRVHRHVGTQWRLNSHLGLVTPPGVAIRVWNETRQYEVGKTFAFLDAAEHDVTHSGTADRCVLNVVSWHPNVLERRLADSAFADNFAFEKLGAAAD